MQTEILFEDEETEIVRNLRKKTKKTKVAAKEKNEINQLKEEHLVDLTEISSLQLKDDNVSKVIDMVDAGMPVDINWCNLQFAVQ